MSPALPSRPPLGAAPTGRTPVISTLVLTALLALTVARTTLNEAPFRNAPLQEAGAYAPQPPSQFAHSPAGLLRVLSATAILALAAAWAFAAALSGAPLRLRHPLFGVWTALLAFCLFASASRASDQRAGFDTALEQTSLLAAAFVAMQVAQAHWQRRLVLLAVAGLAVMLGAEGLHQVFVEIPERVSDFQDHKAAILAAQGLAEGSPEARMYEGRVREISATGWFGLANVFGSLMILAMLSVVGLAVEKWRLARAARADPSDKTKASRTSSAGARELPMSLLAAAVTTLLALPAVATWLLTRSVAAVGCGAVAWGLFALVGLRPDWARRNRGKLLASALAALALGAVALAVVARTQGRLNHRSLEVRRLYWSAAADMVRDRPMLGVGPGNFFEPYLRYRRAGAEEGVKNPHNVVVQALSEYGLPGGLAYLGLLGFVLVKLTSARVEDDDRPAWLDGGLLGLGGVFVLAMAWRIGAIRYPNLVSLIAENAVPVVGLGVGLLAAGWFGHVFGAGFVVRGRGARLGLACGLAGFALHNLTDFALFQPGAAMVFWVSAGALAAGAVGRTWELRRPVAIALAVALSATAVAAAAGIVAPNWRKTAAISAAAEKLAGGQPLTAFEGDMKRAVAADPLDAGPPADLARIYQSAAQQAADVDEAHRWLREAYPYVRLAQRRQPGSAKYEEMMLEALLWEMDPTLLLAAWDRSVHQLPRPMPPWPARTAWHYSRWAEHQYRQGMFDEAADALGQALELTDRPGLLLDHMGDVQYRLGRPAAARKLWLDFLQTRLVDLDRWAAVSGYGVRLLDALNDQSARLHLRLAERAWQAGQTDLALRQVHAALDADAALNPDSLIRLAEWERRRLEMVRIKCEAVSNPSAEPGGS